VTQLRPSCSSRLRHEASLNQLMSRHERLVPFVVRRQTLGKLPFVEAVQAGRIGLWRAIMGYDHQRGYAFSTYACTATPALRAASVARHIWQAVKRAERADPESVGIVPAVTIDETDPAVVWEASAVSAALYAAVERLPERLCDIIMARYGLAGKSATTYREIGATLGFTGERIRQLHTEALVWLRHPAHSQCLRALLERHTVADVATNPHLHKRHVLAQLKTKAKRVAIVPAGIVSRFVGRPLFETSRRAVFGTRVPINPRKTIPTTPRTHQPLKRARENCIMAIAA
jgi:RNA polymerase sigma factor (sigma-70 family)